MVSNMLPLLEDAVKSNLGKGLITPLFNPSINASRTTRLFWSLSFNSMLEPKKVNDVFRKNTRVPL